MCNCECRLRVKVRVGVRSRIMLGLGLGVGIGVAWSGISGLVEICYRDLYRDRDHHHQNHIHSFFAASQPNVLLVPEHNT